MNTPSTPAATTLPTLELLDASGAVLMTVPLIKAGGHAYGRNRAAFQAYDVDTQGASGDGRRVIGERTVDVLIQATAGKSAGALLYELDTALASTTRLQLDGTWIDLSGVAGITATQPLTGNNDGDVRATVTYIPTTQAATDSAGVSVLGPL